MIYDKEIHHRRSIRLQDYDYSQAGAYFVTVCAWNKECLFGEIRDGVIGSNKCGHIIENEWQKTTIVRPNIELDAFVIMPNHFHGIIVLNNNVGARRCFAHDQPIVQTPSTGQNRATRTKDRAIHRIAPTERIAGALPGSLGAVIGQFKSIVTKRINEIRNSPGAPVWQRNYYEHIIRDEDDLNRIRQYIVDNPFKWDTDENNPKNIGANHRRGEAVPRP